MQGKIKKVLSNRGYGFIDPEGSDDDLFFHKSNLEGTDIFSIKEEMAVEFEIADGRRGPEAINIKLLSGEGEPPASDSDE